ncbi:T20D4.11-like domain-containing protein [Caenorhabditis elegans]|uniref:T20D4.11-like domain-containing protein n=1 Tax=Caenorhabditis elegans TaxID=6239 RepID=Q9XWY0_CAEEL|nr:DUF19 domain-containing protein [Caenorhabditis elegans]CAA21506.3 DUF19 domain-containing protein [Caenorhabditis elegans]|eukprot:NP_507789.3 Uncharacterized protein CELE_Y43F8B.10 [Caenorhabditis elegans]
MGISKTRPKQKLLQAPPILDPDPAPFAPNSSETRTGKYFIYAFIILSIFINGASNYAWFSTFYECSKAEEIVQRMCAPKLERLELLIESTVPEFAMTPIGRDMARKCAEVEECLGAVQCSQPELRSDFLQKCSIFQFFHTEFATCRDVLQKSSKIRENCVKKLFATGPISCDVLNEHLECYRTKIEENCDTDAVFMYHFDIHMYNYAQIMNCTEVELD